MEEIDIVFEEKKERLTEYQKNYSEAKMQLLLIK